MNKNKRIIIIFILIIIGAIIFSLDKVYEERIVLKEKLEKIDVYTPFKKTTNFKQENRERYVKYYERNKNLSYEDVVTMVNIGLDYDFYDYITLSDTNKDILILTNKYLKLDENYKPNDLERIDNKYFINGNKDVNYLRKEAKEAFERLSADSIKNNTPVYGQSAYRSYERQNILYNEAVKSYGKEKADLDTARAGHSEHQTGLTIDVSSNKKGNMLNFENTSSYNWMINNAHKYGFILRYPKGKEKIHGFIYEAWHYRYVGVKVATDMHNNYSDLTYDEYYYKFIDNK
ncbi:MAG: M15 family metallopeptidase [Bacilli bacterium]